MPSTRAWSMLQMRQMKITIEPNSNSKGIFSAETDAEHIDDVAQLFKGLLVSAGYHPTNVDKLFNSGTGDWYPESEPIDEHNLFQQTN